MDLVGVVLAGLSIALVLAVSQFLYSSARVDSFTARKIVHVAVAHWWLLAMFFHDSAAWASVGPAFFIIFNAVNHQVRVVTATETEATRANWGTVYYPVALLILVWLSFAGPMPQAAAAVGVLSLGWGDGLAPLGGRLLPVAKMKLFGNTKTIGGTLTVLLASAIVGLAVSLLYLTVEGPLLLADAEPRVWLAVTLGPALVAAVLELFTPFGLDNLTVPLGVSAAYWGIVGLLAG